MAQMQKKAVLRIVQDGKLVEQVELGAGMLSIGREEVDIILEDVEVSTVHCQIQAIGGEHHLFDLNSTNGTFVNGQRIVKAKLVSGDRIRVGRSEFLFAIESLSEEVAPAIPVFDFQSLQAPVSDLGREVDEILSRERQRFLECMQLVVDASYFDGQSETLVVAREILVGRSSPHGKFSADEEMSRRHARVFIGNDGEAWVEDLGSTNGVLVNGSRISKPTRLGVDDLVKVGRARLKVQSRPAPEYCFS